VTLDHIDSMCSLSLSSVHIGLHALNTFTWFGFNTVFVMLIHVVMSVVQVFPSFMMLRLACVFVRDGLLSIEM
jgi:hypothetical protein